MHGKPCTTVLQVRQTIALRRGKSGLLNAAWQVTPVYRKVSDGNRNDPIKLG